MITLSLNNIWVWYATWTFLNICSSIQIHIHRERKISAVLLISLCGIKHVFIIIITTPHKVKRQQTWSPQQKFYASLRHIKLPVQFHLDILLFFVHGYTNTWGSVWDTNNTYLLFVKLKTKKKFSVCKRNKNFLYA